MFISLLLPLVSGWTGSFSISTSCMIRERDFDRHSSKTYLGRRCPWHYNCNFSDGSVYSNGTHFDYENCQMYQCGCSGEQIRTDSGYVELKPCTGIQTKIGRTCNYVMPTGCAFELEKCGYGARFYHEHDDSLECKPIVYWCTKT